MADTLPKRAHLIAGGFPPGSDAGHDQDFARLRLLEFLAARALPTSVAGDYSDLEKWLKVSRLLVTYVAGPYPNEAQCGVLQAWLAAGGHWLALHGTSGGKAERVDGVRQRRTVKMAHHALLGGMFLTHPPQCRFHVDVRAEHPITAGLGAGFDIEDEPYFVELQDPANTTILLSAAYGDAAVSTVFPALYPKDTSLQADGRTRVLAYTKQVGQGGVTYVALGHCHSPAARPERVADPNDPVPATFFAPWENEGFRRLLGNAVRFAAALT